MKNAINLGVLLLLLSGCRPTPPHIVEAHRVMNKFEKRLKGRKVEIMGSGGAMFGDIKEFIYTLVIYDSPNIDQARNYIVNIFEILIDEVNTDLKVRPYLHEFPHDEKAAHISLSFFTEPFEPVRPPAIECVSIYGGKIYYSVFDGLDRLSKEVYSESYAEAYQKVYGKPLPDRRLIYGALSGG